MIFCQEANMMSNNSSNANGEKRGNNDERNDDQQSKDTKGGEGSKHNVIQSPLKFT